MGSLWQDVKIGLRMLRRSPGFAAIAIATLALGIGANTAIFTLIDTVMLKSLPVGRPDQLAMLDWQLPHADHGLIKRHFEWPGCPRPAAGIASCTFSYETFQSLRDHAASFAGLFAFAGPFQVGGIVNGRAHLADFELVSGGYFQTLGVHPILGRSIGPDDDRAGTPVAVLSYKEWQEPFEGRASAIGQSITVAGTPATIIGVMPRQFFGLDPAGSPDVWLPLGILPKLNLSWFGLPFFSLADSGDWWLQVAGRLKPGTSPVEAGAQANAIFHESVAAALGSSTRVQIPTAALFSVSRGLDSLRQPFFKPLIALLVLVALVLLIACVNVAGLLLTRAAGREREMALRVALGASRYRLTRQFLVESLLISLLGGAAGWLLALWGTELLGSWLASGDALQTIGTSPDWHVLGFAIGISSFAGIAAGLAPAFRAGRTDISPTCKATLFGGGSRHGSRFSLALGKGLVIAQVAIALVVICAAGLFARTLVNLENVRLGFNARDLLLFQLDPELNGYKQPQQNSLYRNAQRQLSALPGVTSVSWSNFALLGNSEWNSALEISGRKYADIRLLWVGPQFFQTMGIPILLGRRIELQDGEGAPLVAVINEAFARKIGNANPVGLHFTGGVPGVKKDAQVAVIGVAGNARYSSLRELPPPTLYLPELQGGMPGATFEVRTATDPNKLIPAVRQTLARLAPDVPLSNVETQTDQDTQALGTERDIARLSGFFAFLALALSCLGLYGLIAYSVVRRTSEIGLRMALGAAPEEVLRMVLALGAKLATGGIVIGLALVIALTRVVSSMLYGVSGNDPLTLATATVLLVAVALLATCIPARRATRIDPVAALRHE